MTVAEDAAAPVPAGGSLRRIASFGRYVFAASGRRMAVVLALMILASVTEGISIMLLVPMLRFLDTGTGAPTLRLPASWTPWPDDAPVAVSLPLVLLLLVALVSLRGLLMRWKDVYTIGVLFDFLNALRNQLFRSITRARWEFLARTRMADLDHALTADIDRVQAAAMQALVLIQTLIMLAVYVLVSCVISPTMTLVALALGATAILVLAPMRRLASDYGQSVFVQRREQYRIISEYLGGIKVAKAYNTEGSHTRALAATLGRMRDQLVHYRRAQTGGVLALQILSAAGLALFVYIALVRYRLEQAQIVVLILLFMRLAPRFTLVQSTIQDILSNLSALTAMLRLRDAADREDEGDGAGGSAPTLDREVRFTGVGFRYAGATDDVLHDVDLVVPAGKVTAIIGPSGSGKSTTVDLLIGLLEPGAGSVDVDGIPLDRTNRVRWRDRIAYVPQDSFLLHDTIAANLRVGSPGATVPQLWLALEQASAAALVRSLPQGLDTVAGDRGLRLSGGERQRIALARALLRRPDLLVLDEATSALDWEHQAAIASAIDRLRGSMTIVTIAHRPSMIAFADHVVVLREGRVAEQGAYRDLVERPNSYLCAIVTAEGAGDPGSGPSPLRGGPSDDTVRRTDSVSA